MRSLLKWFAALLLNGAFICGALALGQTSNPKNLLPENPVVLKPLWRISFGADYATTTDPAEMRQHDPSGVLYYIPANPADPKGERLQPVFRLVSPDHKDHMDSNASGEGGYKTEGTLGYTWSSSTAHPGLSPVQRIYNNQRGSRNFGDHALMVEPKTLPTSGAEDRLAGAGYHPETQLGYAYARYVSTITDQVLSRVSGGGITAASNAVVGCTIYEWTWSGVQFVNDFDYGRQISSAFGEIGGVGVQSNNPTENGDKYGGGPANQIPLMQRHGSPCLSIKTEGNVQSTRAIPLEWNPDAFGGGPDNPVIYPDLEIGKNLTLGWSKDGVARPIALYQTVISSPAAMNYVQVEVPSAYLLAKFNHYYVYYPGQAAKYKVPACLNAGRFVSEALIEIPVSSPCFDNKARTLAGFAAGALAVILSSGSSPGSPAMAIYNNSENASVVIYDGSRGAHTGQYGENFAKGSFVWSGAVPATSPNDPWTFNSWIVTDTFENVQKDVRLLYSWGVESGH